ncbi:hypothetical protein FOA43_002599 [Brettanomyces nanus]|uniref:Potassium channel domain-containing protein n=1 Tax=Eeniella nana TaxID=13502 RepID=A0A875S688_EENNA|nr:uncharacterized protein FOA43_002599 [Brettanomyces nanus]QPG75249.1 hypothetical protein FOA43_002599 [Brettanomyces nanus]
MVKYIYDHPPGLPRVATSVQDYYDTSLNTIEWRISNLNVVPGDRFFVFWFMLSSYFPLISGCIGPLSNMMSLFAIACAWKTKEDDSSDEIYSESPDEYWVYLLNGISVLLALISNFFLILNFRKKVRYTVSQVVSVSGWFLGSVILMALVIAYHAFFYQNHLDDDYILGYGFYFAIVTVCLHFLNFVLLFLNEMGFLLKKYQPVFNINDVQKSLIFQSLALSIWLITGSAMCMKLFDASFGFSLYYCIISIVTIGEQQDVPANSTAEGLTTVWILIGLVVFGLIVASVFDTVIDFSRSTLYWHRLATTKRVQLELKRGTIVGNQEAYQFMRGVDDMADISQKIHSLVTSSIVFSVIFLFGALGFCLIEHWSYSKACYFCFCCLMTLGCGGLIPVTVGGRVLFCVWALASIPSMTTLVSSLSGLIFSRLKKINDIDMYDIFFNITNNHHHFKLIAKLFRAKKDSIDLDDLDVLMHETDVSISKLSEKKESSSRGLPASTDDFNEVDVVSSKVPIKSVYAAVPLPTHPVDTLYSFIFNNNKLSSLEFINSPQFIDRVTMSTHLSNYIREGCEVVRYDKGRIQSARENLLKAFNFLDSSFDEQTFLRNYELTEGFDAVEPDVDTNTSKNVLKLPNGIIQTMFHKKNDFVLKNLSSFQILLSELKKAMLLMCLKPEFQYTFEDWDRFLQLTQNSDYLEDNENGQFWIGDRSPLGYPNLEPQYFAMTYLRHLESKLHRFAWDYDMDNYKPNEKPIDVAKVNHQ